MGRENLFGYRRNEEFLEMIPPSLSQPSFSDPVSTKNTEY